MAKRNRGTFSMPLGVCTFVSPLRAVSKKIGRTVKKKSEVSGARLNLLKAMLDDALQSVPTVLAMCDTKPR
jgi:hypothetical protein